MVTSDKSISSDDHWIQAIWRPLVAYQYLVVCIFDFLLFPILTALFHLYTNTPYTPWDPLTLKEGGFYHMSMMAIIGVTAWTRGQLMISKQGISQQGTEQ